MAQVKIHDTGNPFRFTFSNDPAAGIKLEVMSAIRRAIFSVSKCVAFRDIISPSDYTKYEEIFNLKLNEVKNYVVLKSTRENVQMLADRMSRIAINVDPESAVIDEIYFAICNEDEEGLVDPSNPYVHEEDEPKKIFCSDLKSFKVVITKEGEEGEEGEEGDGESKETIEYVPVENTFFKYDSHLTTLTKGDELHAILKPEVNIGYINSRWQPCTVRYYYGEAVGVETTDFDNETPTIYVTVEYNGKIDPAMASINAVKFILEQLKTFLTLYQSGESTESFVFNDEDYTINIGLVRPHYLGDHSMGNLISSYLLKNTLSKIEPGELKSVKISSKKPHPLMENIILQYQLPERLMDQRDDIMEETITELIDIYSGILDTFTK